MECASSSDSSDWEEEVEEAAVCIKILENKANRRTLWTHEINKKRESLGEFHRLIQELESDPHRFHMYFRMQKEDFDFLHDLIKNHIFKEDTFFRRSISTRERLAVCLRFLATGNSFRSIGFSYRMGFSTVRIIVKEVCEAIWKVLSPIVMPKPTKERWIDVAAKFKQLWNFPNCIGAIDGKHVNIQCPINSGSNFFNYKGCHSVVLMAIVDAEYKFIAVDVGSYGRNSDGSIFANSSFGKALYNNTFDVPEKTSLTHNSEPQPHVIVGDEAFPLTTFLLRPHGKHNLVDNESNKIFNYRLSRARRVVENAFGILVSRWRVFKRHMEVQPDMVDKIVLAACCLHNMLCTKNDFQPDLNYLKEPSGGLLNLNPLRRNSTRNATQIREAFKEFFISEEGSVPWQIEVVRTGRNHRVE